MNRLMSRQNAFRAWRNHFRSGVERLRGVAITLAICTLILAGGRQAISQTDAGSINGVIEDAGNARVPGAKVTLTNIDTGLVLTQTSAEDGNYMFSPVRIGHYSVSVTAPGFTTTTQSNLVLNLQQHLEVDLKLAVGDVTQQVEVTTAPPLIQTEDASVGQEVSAQTIDDTPLNGRNWVYMAQLSAGVAPVTSSRGGASGDFSANGQRADMNNFILDGVDNNTSVVDFLNGASYNVRPPPDALSQFKVQTADFSAEFGHSAGAVVNASIKSGTNEIHGSAWEYVRNTALDSKDWNLASIPSYHENQFGATLGLPIFKNKLFFFGDLEANRISTIDPTSLYTVPTANMRTGDFSDLLNGAYNGTGKAIQLYEPGTHTPIPGNRLDQDQNLALNPVALKILSMYPCPTASGSTSYLNNCRIIRPVTDNTFQFDNRVDWNIGSNDQVFVRFSLSNERVYKASPLGPILDGGAFNDSGHGAFVSENIALSESHIFNARLTNEFRLGYNYGHFTLTQPNANTDVSSQLGLGGIPFFPNNGGLPYIKSSTTASTTVPNINLFNSASAAGFGTPSWYYTTEHQNIGQILDNVTKITGNHSLRFGVSLQYIRFATLQPQNARGGYTFNGQYTGGGTGAIGSGVADFLLDKINDAFITSFAQSDQLRWDNAAFAQDDWKIAKAFTVNIGVRWEDPTSYRDLFGRQSNLVPTSPLGINSGTANFLVPIQSGTNSSLGNFTTFAGPRISVVNTPNQYLVSNAWRNFGPRLGAAYQLSNRAVVRGGFGLFYGGAESAGYSSNIGANFPFLPTSDFAAASCSTVGGVTNCPVAKSNLGNPITLGTGFTDPLSTGLVAAATLPITNAIAARTRVPYTENYNISAEYAITHTMSAKLAYVGSESHLLGLSQNINGAYALQTTGTNINSVRAFPGLGNAQQLEYEGQSSYNSLQASLSHQTRELTFSANYTYAHSIGIGTGVVNGGGTATSNSPLVPFKNNAANSSFDVRQRFTFNGNYRFPFGINRRFANSSKLQDTFIGGWNTSLTFSAQTGIPFSVTTANGNGFNPAAGVGTLWAIPVSNPFVGGGTPPAAGPMAATQTCPTQVHTRAHWYNPCAFVNPLSGSTIPIGTKITGAAALPYFGNTHSNQIHGPGFERVNMSLFKNFLFFHESKTLELRADAFNLLNHPSWTNPSTADDSANGGVITGSVPFQKNTPDARFLQLSAKVMF